MTTRVLVVDDNFYNVKLLEAKLQIAGCEVATAFNGEEALAKIEQSQPAIVLLDVMMPGMSGYDVCRRLRQAPATAKLPVVLVTALDKPSDRQAGLEAGADEFITKPVDEALLLATMQRLLAARGALLGV
jgi:two-component system cell cycle response regulator